MIRETALEIIKAMADEKRASVATDNSNLEALEIAIKALEQEPCEDAVSRQALLDKLDEWDWQELYLPIHFKENIIDELPSVQPKAKRDRTVQDFVDKCRECGEKYGKLLKSKTGHWTHDGSHWKNRFICSECNYKLFDEPTNYCPNCGARMGVDE